MSSSIQLSLRTFSRFGRLPFPGICGSCRNSFVRQCQLTLLSSRSLSASANWPGTQNYGKLATTATTTDTVASRRGEKERIRAAPSVRSVLENGKAGERVRVQGWVKGLRKQKKYTFFDVSDGLSSAKLPVIVATDKVPKGLSMHASVDVSGVLETSPKNAELVELQSQEVIVVGPCDQEEFPLGGKTKYTPDYIRQYMHLRLKTRRFGAVMRTRDLVTNSIYDFFRANEFVHVHTPIISSNDCEGAGETFTILPDSEDLIKEMMHEKGQELGGSSKKEEVFFDKKVHLSVSGQLHLECASGGLSKVWTLSPAFRAENSKSTRHLSEFYMLEAEVSFAYDIEDILELMENLIKSCVEQVLHRGSEDLEMISDNEGESSECSRLDLLETIVRKPFTVMTFDDAKQLLLKKADSVVIDEKGLSREQELLLTEKLNNNVPVFVIDWPSAIKPFYMRQCSYDNSKVSAVDLLVPGIGELCGGSLREFNQDLLASRINCHDPSGALRQSLSWYLALRKYGCVPSGGFGLGFDRLIQLVTGIKTIKDVTPFPRWAHHCQM